MQPVSLAASTIPPSVSGISRGTFCREHNLLAAGLGLAASPATAGLDYPAVSERCFNFEGGGPYLYGREEETGKDYCYVIDYVNHLELIPMCLPRGNFLKYSKLDRSRRGGR